MHLLTAPRFSRGDRQTSASELHRAKEMQPTAISRRLLSLVPDVSAKSLEIASTGASASLEVHHPTALAHAQVPWTALTAESRADFSLSQRISLVPFPT